MKMLFTAVALATLVTSSAFAHPGQVSSNVSLAYTHLGSPHVWGTAVYRDGRVVGQDPDANVRMQLLRDKADGGR